MPSRNPEAGELARQYCRDHAGKSSRAIAKMLYRMHPHVYGGEEVARNAVRYYRGALGVAHRRKTAGKLIERIAMEIPKSTADTWEPVVLSERKNGWLILADIHFAQHDERALALALEHGIKRGVKDVLLLGDILDCYSISRFGRTRQRYDNMASERDAVRQFISMLRRHFPGEIVWKLGNHELRIPAFYHERCPEMMHRGAYDFRAAMDVEYGEKFLDAQRVRLVEYDILRYGHLALVHGDEWGKGLASPVNPARGAFLRTMECTVSAHLHRTSHHHETATFGRNISCWSVGCLCAMHPAYARLNKWNHGFAILYTMPGGWFEVDNRRIVQGRVV